jgi:hypothetical protein
MEYTGHSDMATTMRYLRPAESETMQSRISSIAWVQNHSIMTQAEKKDSRIDEAVDGLLDGTLSNPEPDTTIFNKAFDPVTGSEGLDKAMMQPKELKIANPSNDHCFTTDPRTAPPFDYGLRKYIS